MRYKPLPWPELKEKIAELVVAILILVGISYAVVTMPPMIKSIAACPIHITTSYSDYCMSIGIGR